MSTACKHASFSPTLVALAVTLALGQSHVYAAASVDPALNLGALTGGIGVSIPGKSDGDKLGVSVKAAGDINDDGVDDLIMGAPGANNDTGETYVVFGGSSLSSNDTFSLSNLDGNNGFVITGRSSGDESGFSVSGAGDVNGDGIDDLIVGAPNAGTGGSFKPGFGYIIFGGASVGITGSISLNSIGADNGLLVRGSPADDKFGRAVSSAGDVNGDGVDDLIIASPFSSVGSNESAGISFLFRGIQGLQTNAASFSLYGIDQLDRSGQAVSGAGDVNGDGFDDFIIGAPYANPGFRSDAGNSYVVFGNADITTTNVLQLGALNGTNGITLEGDNQEDNAGFSVSAAGDVNGDGLDDLIMGAIRADANGLTDVGKSYVVFGQTNLGNNSRLRLNALTGPNGFTVTGNAQFDRSGYSVAAAGDVNGDGFADLLIAAPNADPDGKRYAGETYVVLGGAAVGSSGELNLGDLDGSNGFTLTGETAFDRAGFSVSGAGDVNNDGVDDLIIGARGADSYTGESYIVFMPLPDNVETGTASSAITSGQTRFLNVHPEDDSLDTLRFSLISETTLVIETANDGTLQNHDTTLQLFLDAFTFPFEPISVAFNDDIEPGVNLYSRITATLPAGNYLLSTGAFGDATIPSYAVSVSAVEACNVSDPALQKTLGFGQFELLSLPCQPPAGTTINDLFGDDIEGGYFDGESGTWVVFTWDPVAFDYVNPGPNGTLEPGQGFWISQAQTNGEAVTLDLPSGSLTTRSTGAAASACASSAGCLSIPLFGRNFPIDPATNSPRPTIPMLIGNPYDQPVTAFDDLRVTTTIGQCSIGSDGCSPDEATLPSAGGENVLGNVAFAFDPTLRDGAGDYAPIGTGSTLDPWQGFWVFELPASIDNNPVVRFPDFR